MSRHAMLAVSGGPRFMWGQEILQIQTNCQPVSAHAGMGGPCVCVPVTAGERVGPQCNKICGLLQPLDARNRCIDRFWTSRIDLFYRSEHQKPPLDCTLYKVIPNEKAKKSWWHTKLLHVWLTEHANIYDQYRIYPATTHAEIYSK